MTARQLQVVGTIFNPIDGNLGGKDLRVSGLILLLFTIFYSLGRQLVEKVLLYVFYKFTLLAWAAWQPVELSENTLQNLIYKLPSHSVQY